GAVAFVSDALSVTGPVGASAALSFAPYTVSAGIGVAGGAGALQLPQTLLDQLTGAASLTIGRVDGSGPIEVGAFVVPSATRLQSGSGNVAFTGPVDSATGTPRSMTVATGGTTTLPAQLGATTPLGSFSVLGASALGADTTLTASTISFGTSVSGPHALTLDGSLQLINNLAISGTDVRFQSIDGAFGLTVNASGASTFAGPVGAGTPLASLVTDAAGTTHLAGSIQASGTIRFNDAVVLDANASVAAGTAPGADSVLFGQAVDGGFGLTVSSAGPAHFAGSVGAGTPLASLASAGTGDVTFDVGSVTTTGAQSYAGLVHLPAGTTLQGAALELAGGGSAHGDLTLLTESLALGAPLAGSGQVAIAPRHAGDSIGLGSAGGTLSIGQSVLDRLAGFDQLLVGRADGSGDLTAQAAVLPMTTTLQGGSGEIRLAGGIDGAVDLTLATGGVTSLVGDIGTNVALRSLHVTDEATHANWDGSAGERTLVEGGAPVRIVTSGTQLYDEPLLASTTLSLQADSVKLPQAVGALTLGDVRLANGGSITSSGVLQLAGALQLDGGTLMLSSTATPTAGSITDPEYAGEGLLFRNALLRENSAAIEQLAGSTIRTAAGSLLALRSPGNGSILIDQAGNQLAGGLSAVTGTPGDNDATRFNVAGSLPLGIVRIAADQLNAAGRFNGDATAPDLGIEADAVHITADRLSTGAGGLIRARLPFDNTQGSQTSLPALTLTLTPGTYTLTGPYGSGAAPASWIQVKLGDQDGGFVTLRPKGDAVTHPDLFVFLAGDPQPRPFYDGSGKTTEIPIFYNGDTPRTPQEVGALNAVTAVVENARRARFEEAVRTENVTSRLRQGVIAEVGAGRPATEGSGTMHMPEPCPVKPGTLECQ
ncbi:MAG: beta strand repeat-containing protein, partial [Betaproteobacteria bacterium]